MSDTPFHTGTAIPAVIVAGGHSSRMGQDKSSVALGARPMIDRIIERLSSQTPLISVNSNTPDLRLPDGIDAFPDTVGGRLGPLAGVLAALRHVRARHPDRPYVATVPTDTPFFPLDLINRLAGALVEKNQIAIAFTGDLMHPIFGLWPVCIADDMERWLLTDGKRRVRGFIARHPMAAVAFPVLDTAAGPFDPFYNINTPEDRLEAERWLAVLETDKA